MACEVGTEWPAEEIPNADRVFMRVHRNKIDQGELDNGAFRDPDGTGMSCDWEKYSTPDEARNRARTLPQDNAVIALRVGAVREIDALRVVHSPIPPHNGDPGNRAHSDIHGLYAASKMDKTEIRAKLRRIAEMVIPLP